MSNISADDLYEEFTGIGITIQQAEMINSTYQSNDDVYSRVDTLKSDSNLNTLPDYQTLCDNDFEDVAWKEAKVLECLKDDDGENLFHYRMDALWYYIGNMKIARSNSKRFKLLPKIAEVVLIIPHSNAELERLFSIVKKVNL